MMPRPRFPTQPRRRVFRSLARGAPAFSWQLISYCCAAHVNSHLRLAAS